MDNKQRSLISLRAAISKVVHEIVHRQITINETKMEAINAMQSEFTNHFRSENVNQKNGGKKTVLKFKIIIALLKKHFDELESQRFSKSLGDKQRSDGYLTYQQTQDAFKKMLDTDLINCINEGFKKLDFVRDNSLCRDMIKNSLINLKDSHS